MLTLLASLLLAAPVPARAASRPETGFLVLAPDRGFLGNAETRDAFDAYRGRFKAALALLGPRGAAAELDAARASLRRQGAGEVVVLPLFVSENSPFLLDAKARLGAEAGVLFAACFGRHPYALEALQDRAAALSRDPRRERLVLVAQGADGPESARRMEADLLAAAAGLDARVPFASKAAVVLEGWDPLRDFSGRSDARLRGALQDAARAGLKPVLVPFDLTVKMDSMMRLANRLGAAAAGAAAFDGADLSPHPALAAWLSRESYRRLPAREEDLGLVFMPHGFDEAWNRLMLDSVAPLAARVPLEPAFGMADPALIERAIRRLEARGVRRIAVVRAYSLDSSFRAETEAVLGLASSAAPAPEHAHHGHVMGPHAMAAPRAILSSSDLVTLGGIGDSPLFAGALYDRVRELSRAPSAETVFLVAHGAQDDAENALWQKTLDSLASQVRELSIRAGSPFRAVVGATLREDWPEKRGPAVAALREQVQKAAASGRAIVVPARTAEGGPERELLTGLDFAYAGTSFAPHPNFLRWVQSQEAEALKLLESRRREGLTPSHQPSTLGAP